MIFQDDVNRKLHQHMLDHKTIASFNLCRYGELIPPSPMAKSSCTAASIGLDISDEAERRR